MRKTLRTSIIPIDRIESKIYLIRDKKVMVDRDLAELYGVETKVLNQAVKRNIVRFPDDFMFKMNKKEIEIWKSQIVISNESNLRSQFVTSSSGYGGRRYEPLVFTEQGVAMLSSVLNSERAIHVNIQIMRIFTKIREMLASNKGLRDKIERMESNYDSKFKVIFEVIKKLLSYDKIVNTEISFRTK